MSVEPVLTALDEQGVLTVTLNRPEVFNALNVPLLEALLTVFQQQATAPEVRCVILTGAGRAFCSGQDLEERRPFVEGSAAPPSLGQSLRKRYNPLVMAMRELPRPVIGAINGVAVGAGCSLALACDLRLAADNAALIESFVRVGLGLDAGSSFMLPRLCGLARSFELALLGDRIDATTAERYGLVNRVVPAEKLLDEAYALAHRLASGPPAAIARIKQELNYALSADLPAALEFEAARQEEAATNPEYREGLSAFFQKRPPDFRK
ncbi:MAG TPA: enoyl-CoA hydratase-related protein [Chloroflexia bacterium]|nr:enoyl-CoA hydratase-related protein [Chloroflexia bacterium]